MFMNVYLHIHMCPYECEVKPKQADYLYASQPANQRRCLNDCIHSQELIFMLVHQYENKFRKFL